MHNANRKEKPSKAARNGSAQAKHHIELEALETRLQELTPPQLIKQFEALDIQVAGSDGKYTLVNVNLTRKGLISCLAREQYLDNLCEQGARGGSRG